MRESTLATAASPDNRLKTRAEARAGALLRRARLLMVVAAVTRVDFVAMRRQIANAERHARDVATAEKISDIATQRAMTQSAIEHLESAVPGGIEIISKLDDERAAAVRLDTDMQQAIDARVRELGLLNDRCEAIERDFKAANTALETVRAIAGTPTLDLYELLANAGLPEAQELLDCASRPTRAGRAEYFAAVADMEAAQAVHQLGMVGSSLEFDRALEDLIGAEQDHSALDLRRAEVERDHQRAIRVHMQALRAVAALGGCPAPAALDAPATATGSAAADPGAGARQESPELQGAGASPTADCDTAAGSPSDSPLDPEAPAPEVAQS